MPFLSKPIRLAVASLGLAASGAFVNAAGPCDIYAQGDTPCIAAHSTTRALYSAYNGSLYQVIRGSDNTTIDISPLSAGGVANAAAQDDFCANTTCLIQAIYDQSGRENNLARAPGGALRGPGLHGNDDLASATGAPVTINGHKAYGVFIAPGTGYRNDTVSGTATGNTDQGQYAVLDGTHYNEACCFDYGNAETSNTDTGNGHMQTIYFGSENGYASGAGDGPWIMADLENGLYNADTVGQHNNIPSISNRFITAVVKGADNDTWAIRGGNAASGALDTYYSGARPGGAYKSLKQEGAIILGIGGDNSNGGQGTFYEGVMTSGYPSDSTENAVQANVVAAEYETTPLVSGPAVTVGSVISFRATTACCTGDFLTHDGAAVKLQAVTSSSSSTLKQQASWKVVTGLGFSGCVSFQSVDAPDSYLRHSSFQLVADVSDGSKKFKEDATFCPETGLTQGNAFRSWSHPTRYFRHYLSSLYLAANGGVRAWDAPFLFHNDASWTVTEAFASS